MVLDCLPPRLATSPLRYHNLLMSELVVYTRDDKEAAIKGSLTSSCHHINDIWLQPECFVEI